MDKPYIGNFIVGNFKMSEKCDDIKNFKLEKRNRELKLESTDKVISLKALNHDTDSLVEKFSNENEAQNYSIYKLELNDNVLVVMLYLYERFASLDLTRNSFSIHLRREDEKKLCNEGLKIGSKYYTLNSISEIPNLFNDIFINNRSIFLHENNSKNGDFQMFGSNGIRCKLLQEKPGVYVIDRFMSSRNTEYEFTLLQVFGNVSFVTWDDASSLKGNQTNVLENIKTNDIFTMWNKFMDFQTELFNQQLKEFNIIRYSSIELYDDEIQFMLSSDIDLDIMKEVDFDFLSKSSLGESHLPSNNLELINYLSNTKSFNIHLSKIKLKNCTESKLVFNVPNRFKKEMCKDKGILFLSNSSIKRQNRRRKNVLGQISLKNNITSNNIMRLSSPDVVDDSRGTTLKPLNNKIIKHMFGSLDIIPKENYVEALDIALNTPDIALIQGPPGTGKTTLINGLVARLNEMSSNNKGVDKVKVLVASEQHEALHNVIEKLSSSDVIPPYVASKRNTLDEIENDEEKFLDNIKSFQNKFQGLCNEILLGTNYVSTSNLYVELSFIIQDIINNSYSKFIAMEKYPLIKDIIIKLGIYDKVKNELEKLDKVLLSSFQEVESNPLNEQIIKKIDSQRTDIDSFLDDGVIQLNSLQRLLKSNDYENLLLNEEIKDKLKSDNNDLIISVLDDYVKYIEMLSANFEDDNSFLDLGQSINLNEEIDKLYSDILKIKKESPKNFMDIIEELNFKLNDIDTSVSVVQKYTSIIGTTCAQSYRANDIISNVTTGKYDYVIIDEAARANPLDLMIPLMLGTKVILVGDHKQLPHYIESEDMKKFDKSLINSDNVDLLSKSLFEIIYENIDKGYKEGRIKYKRAIRINEQHRMHPTIGSFISNEFYEGTIENGINTIQKINDFGIFNGKNLAWVNMPIYSGKEERNNHDITRYCEVEKIVEIISNLISNNPNKQFDIGVISFYKGQVNLINKVLKEKFPEDVLKIISCNTVDSYQGKEFDITIVSGVRCNKEITPQKSIGFISNSPSRVNVALSRAKKLLIVVADEQTYSKSQHFVNLVNYIKEVGHYE